MSKIENLRKKQALLYYKMSEHRDRYEFYSNFLLSCDLSHEDIIATVKHQMKFENYHLESFVSFFHVLMKDRLAMNIANKQHPELYPKGCRDIYFEMHKAFKEDQIKKKAERFKIWANKRNKMLKQPLDEELDLKNVEPMEDEDHLEPSDMENGRDENDMV